MKPSVLVAAPTSVARHLASALTEDFDVLLETDPRKAAVLAIMASIQAVVVWDGFLAEMRIGRCKPLVTVVARDELGGLAARVAAAIPSRKFSARSRSAGLAAIAALPYEEFLELSRYWTTREYLLGLMRSHAGNVSDAARAAAIERESLHRLLRRHDLDAEMFRPHDTAAAPAASASASSGEIAASARTSGRRS